MTRALRSILVLGAIALVAVGAVGVWALQAESGDFAFVPRAAQSTAGVVELEGAAPPPAGAGRIYFTTVGVRRATVWETWFGVDGGELVPEHAVQPDGESDDERARLDTLAMDDSQEAAQVVGLRALGEEVAVRPTGVIVVGIDAAAPAAKAGLELGDVVLSLNRMPTTTVAALRSRLRAAGVGATVDLGLHRDGRMIELATRTTRSPKDGSAVLGIIPQQASLVDAERRVTFTLKGVGGPSAGLAFALQIYTAGKAYANLRGLRVAATGTIDMDGRVGPIGGAGEKAVGARRAGADLMLVPADNAAEARAAHVPGLRIVAVRTFDDALRAIDEAARAAS